MLRQAKMYILIRTFILYDVSSEESPRTVEERGSQSRYEQAKPLNGRRERFSKPL